MEPVRSPRNQRVAAAVRLRRARERRETQMTFLEGPNLLEAAAAAGASVGPVFALDGDHETARIASAAEYELVIVTQAVLERLAPTKHPRGPVAIMPIPPSATISDRHILVLWGVADPGNAGTLIRTAAAFGFGVAVGSNSVDPWSPKVLRAAAGAHFAVPVESPLADLGDLRKRGLHTVASVVRDGVTPDAISGSDRMALIVGGEGQGLPDEVAASCDSKVTIPMLSNLESLNASVAGSILMYELAKRRG